MSLIGLDVGTSQVKAVRFDHQWKAVDSEAVETVVAGSEGRSEQDMDEVWAAAVRVVAAVVGRCPDTVDLLAVTAQGDGCWLVDDALRPVGPAVLWNDARAAEEVEQWQRDGTLELAFGISGSVGAPGTPHAVLRWLQHHDPERLEAARWLLSCGGWVHARLTGRAVVDSSEVANPFGDATTGEYAPELMSVFGLEASQRLLPPVVRGQERLAPLTDEAARAMGLVAGTPVALAPYDVVATAIGAGATSPGDGFAVLGTTLCVGVVDTGPRLDRPANGMSLPMGDDDTWLIAYATLTGTQTLHWAAQLLGLPDVRALGALAETAPIDGGPLLLPYLSPAGERSPFLDSRVRGSLHGLELGHGRTELARSVFEGLTLALMDCVQAAGGPRTLTLSGGGARSDLWCQMICDALGIAVLRPDTVEVGARGAVLAGAVAQGEFVDLRAAVAAAVSPGEPLMPAVGRAEVYQRRHAELVRVREGLAR